MKALLVGTVLAGLTLATAPPVLALPMITSGDLNIVGNATFNGTQVQYQSAGSILPGGATGDFASLPSCINCITMTNPLTFSPFVGGLIYSGTDNGLQVSFTASSEIIPATISSGGKTLSLDYAGTTTLTGFAPTASEWVFTVNKITHQLVGSFSSVTAPIGVPEPGSLAVLGVGLLGLVAIHRRRNNKIA